MRCRTCRTPKWKGDPCLNPDCAVNTTTTIRLRARTKPISASTKHGFHAPMTTTTQFTADYDAPIRAKNWRTAS